MKLFKMHFVIGPICSGKSSYISAHFSNEEFVVVRIGKFLRESIGLKAMSQDPSPNVCNVTEDWVRRHGAGAMWCAKDLSREVVFDGYPRSVGQVKYLSDLAYQMCNLHDLRLGIKVHLLSVRRDTVERRILERASGNSEAAAFDRLRIDSSFEGVEKIMEQMQRSFHSAEVAIIDHN